MLKKLLLLFFSLTMLHNAASAYDVVLTVASNKPVYELGETAVLTATLKNMSPDMDYIVASDIEYRFTVSLGGVELWRWSHEECG